MATNCLAGARPVAPREAFGRDGIGFVNIRLGLSPP
jgi:hypothetical protein